MNVLLHQREIFCPYPLESGRSSFWPSPSTSQAPSQVLVCQQLLQRPLCPVLDFMSLALVRQWLLQKELIFPPLVLMWQQGVGYLWARRWNLRIVKTLLLLWRIWFISWEDWTQILKMTLFCYPSIVMILPEQVQVGILSLKGYSPIIHISSYEGDEESPCGTGDQSYNYCRSTFSPSASFSPGSSYSISMSFVASSQILSLCLHQQHSLLLDRQLQQQVSFLPLCQPLPHC